MRGTWQTTDGGLGQLVIVLAPLAGLAAVVAVVVEFAAELLVIAGTVVVATLAVVVVMAVRMRRRGQLPLSPVVHWEPHAALPVSPATPVTATPIQALPAPQTFNNYYFGSMTPAQLAEASAAIRGYGHELWRHREESAVELACSGCGVVMPPATHICPPDSEGR